MLFGIANTGFLNGKLIWKILTSSINFKDTSHSIRSKCILYQIGSCEVGICKIVGNKWRYIIVNSYALNVTSVKNYYGPIAIILNWEQNSIMFLDPLSSMRVCIFNILNLTLWIWRVANTFNVFLDFVDMENLFGPLKVLNLNKQQHC
jgi:hypothetical protein